MQSADWSRERMPTRERASGRLLRLRAGCKREALHHREFAALRRRRGALTGLKTPFRLLESFCCSASPRPCYMICVQ